MLLWLLLFVVQSQASVIVPKQRDVGIDSFGLPVVNLLQPRQFSTGNYCYTLDEDPYLFFTTKTAYEYTRGDLYNDLLPETCEPIQLWSFNRHGTRLPGPTEIPRFSQLGDVLAQIRENHKAGKVALCDEDYAFLNTWTWNASITPSMANDLVARGFMDLKGIGMRLKNRFPDLVNDTCGGSDYYFQHTTTDRTRESFESFVKGIFYDECQVNATESDEVIKEYLNCNSWHEEYTHGEFENFVNSPDFQEMATRVSKRLGFEENLNASLIETIYLQCAFEKAWNIYERSKWCAIFTDDDLLILEYALDLKSYYKSGYGREEQNKQLGCPILKNLYNKLNNTITGTSKEPKATFYFSHSKAVHQLLLNLGLYKDEIPLKGDNYKEQLHRKFRTSIFGQFATNVLVVLNQCSDTEDPFQIEVYVGEHIETLCSSGKLCSWTEFSQKYADAIQNCDLSFCEN